MFVTADDMQLSCACQIQTFSEVSKQNSAAGLVLLCSSTRPCRRPSSVSLHTTVCSCACRSRHGPCYSVAQHTALWHTSLLARAVPCCGYSQVMKGDRIMAAPHPPQDGHSLCCCERHIEQRQDRCQPCKRPEFLKSAISNELQCVKPPSTPFALPAETICTGEIPNCARGTSASGDVRTEHSAEHLGFQQPKRQ